MKCPILTAGNLERFPPENEEFLDCLKDACGWWDAQSKKCAILSLAKQIKVSLAR